MNKLKVFISSVQGEFAQERKALAKFLREDVLLGSFFEVFLFEETPATDHSPDAVYLGEVKKSDIYIGLLGTEYGYEDRKGISPTEREYEQAKAKGVNRWVFIKGNNSLERHPKEKALIDKVSREISRKRFSNFAQLKKEVYHTSVRYLKQTGKIESHNFDESLNPQATLKDISPEKIREFVLLAREKRGFPLRETATPKQVLKHLNMFRNNQLTNSALLAFSDNPQRFFPTATVKCAHFHGLHIQKPIPDYKEFGGTAFEMAQEATDFVLSKLSLSTGTRDKSNRVETVYEIPRRAVAEAVINAVAHRDYQSKGSIQLSVFSNPVEITNPGSLPPELDLDKITRPHGSFPHNPLLAGCLFLTGDIERYGTGIMEILELARERQLNTPVFSLEEGFKVTLWRPSAATVQDTAQDTVQDTAQDARWLQGIENPAHRLVWIIEEAMSREEIMARLELTHRGHFAGKYLNPALAGQWVERTLPDKPTSKNQKYRLTSKGRQLKDQLNNRKNAG